MNDGRHQPTEILLHEQDIELAHFLEHIGQRVLTGVGREL